MNPVPMLIADLKALRWTAFAIVLLVAMAVAVGVTVTAQERSFRKASAAATLDFDLLIAAPGSQSQVLLTTVFVQPDALPLMDGTILNRLLDDKRVRFAAPVALGDVSLGYPLVGTTRAFATRWGRIQTIDGRLFNARTEAVVGADVHLAIGETIVPAHGQAGMSRTPGIAQPEETEHRHEASYTIVGRLPRLGTPWDQAILVPIESIWAIHGHDEHIDDKNEPKPSFEAFQTQGTLPGIPAIVVKPATVADAYALRNQYRHAGTMAFFPAEVLVSLYGVLGDLRDTLVIASMLNTFLIFAAVLLLLWAVAGLRRQRYAVLRALGASRAYILLLVWLNALVLLVCGCLVGLVLGWASVLFAAHLLKEATGLNTNFVFDSSDVILVATQMLIASFLSLIPAILFYNAPVANGLRHSS